MPSFPAEDRTDAVRLEQKLDLYAAAQVRELLLAALDGAGALTVDLAAVTGCDAAGVQLLLAARASAAARGRPLTFAAVPEPVARCCERLGLPPLA